MYAKQSSVFKDLWNRQHNAKIGHIGATAKDDRGMVQRLGLLTTLQVHKGCVNTICWNDSGNLILSGSDDQHLVITNGFSYKVEANCATSHKANIFSAKFLPYTSDLQIVSCSGDGVVLHTDLNRQQESCINQFLCHGGTTTYEVLTVPDSSNTFMSCGEDGTVRWFDLREKSHCQQQKCKENILISCQRAITSLAISPVATHQLAVGCADSTVRIYDRRYLSLSPGEHLLAQPFCTFVAPKFGDERHYRITSLSYDSDGKDMLVSYSSDYLYLFNVQECSSTQLKKPAPKPSVWDKLKAVRTKRERVSPPLVRRLRLRGDWSDTGPDARPERDASGPSGVGQARPQLQATLMQRMTDVLSRMLNDPMTRAALSAGGEDSVDADENSQRGLEGGSAGIPGSGGSVETDDGRGEESTEQPVQPTSTSEPATPNQTGENSAVTIDLHNHLAALRNLRRGFINQHGSEPSVSFRYSGQSTSSSTISLRANNENPAVFRRTSSGTDRRNIDMDVDSSDDDDEQEQREMEEEPVKEPEPQVVQPTINMYEAEVKKKYTGHRNARTMIKEATFWGSNYVMSGSDCGHVFVWDRHTAELQMLLQADQHVVNCLQPHPTFPILATSGIDHDVKLWAPVLNECGFDPYVADDLISRNAIMLEETRDTITVPAAFMIRMLACLNQIRRGARNRRSFNVEEDS